MADISLGTASRSNFEMSTQNRYASLLSHLGMGEGLHTPDPTVQIGDVAYFQDTTYNLCFNIFDLSAEVNDFSYVF
jgi:hypothetical protein